VLITIDTLRADRVTPALTPALHALASRGARFTQARSVAPLTLPAHVSLMTGLIPPRHGVRLNGADRFDGAVPTLASLLRASGYRTAAVVGAYVLDRRFGLDVGFETYDDRIERRPGASARLEAERRGDAVVSRALEWLVAQGGDPARPLFLWVHLYDPHAPYEPPAEYRTGPAHGSAYDGEVAFADAQVARVLKGLDAAGRRDALVAVAGDHGESLGDHGETTHGMLLYESALRVPLVVAGAGVPAAEHADPVGLVDVLPTLLARAGVAVPPGIDGRDLLDRSAPRETTGYAETEYPRLAGWSPLAMLIDARWKLVDASRPELYDLSADPGERVDVSAARGETVSAMRAHLARLRAPAAGAPSRAAVASDVAERLRALGYVAAVPARAPASGAPNPAGMMPAWRRFEEAVADVSGSARSRAVEALAALAREHPESPLFQTTLARALSDAGRHREALDVYRRAVARWPDDSLLFHDLAVSARAAGRADEARRAEDAALALDPDNALAHNGRGLLLVDAGRTPEARRAFERAAALDPTNAEFLTHAGHAARQAGDATAAERAYRQALDRSPRAADALNGLGVLLVQRNQPREAVPLLERALAADPQFVEARLNLGIAWQEAGDRERAAAAYRQVLRAPERFRTERDAASALLAALERAPGR
jgi:arylsulfatase A-like enzyme/Flp pilus assembly protein TadD